MKLLLVLLGLFLTITIASAGHGHRGGNKNSTHEINVNQDNYHGNHHDDGGDIYAFDESSPKEDYNYHPYKCGPKDNCRLGEVCHRVGNECKCLPIAPYKDICLSSKTIGVWQDGQRGGCTYSQYDITIENHSNRNIKEIFIGTDYSLKLRDQSQSASLWNMVKLPKGILVLPSYQQSINKDASYTFGFIIEGARPANLHILSVLFE